MASLAESIAANRLPGDIACKVARQVVQAVAYMLTVFAASDSMQHAQLSLSKGYHDQASESLILLL